MGMALAGPRRCQICGTNGLAPALFLRGRFRADDARHHGGAFGQALALNFGPCSIGQSKFHRHGAHKVSRRRPQCSRLHREPRPVRRRFASAAGRSRRPPLRSAGRAGVPEALDPAGLPSARCPAGETPARSDRSAGASATPSSRPAGHWSPSPARKFTLAVKYGNSLPSELSVLTSTV